MGKEQNNCGLNCEQLLAGAVVCLKQRGDYSRESSLVKEIFLVRRSKLQCYTPRRFLPVMTC